MVEPDRDFFEARVRQIYDAMNEPCPTGGEFDRGVMALTEGWARRDFADFQQTSGGVRLSSKISFGQAN
jgi:hypothetical protein